MHQQINRTLATIALVLSIVIMVAAIVGGISTYQRLSGLSDSLGDLGSDTPTVEPVVPELVEPGDPGYEPFCYVTELGEEICE
jgi:hypothetical protein